MKTVEEKAHEAKQALPILKHAFIDIREGLVRQLEVIPLGDKETQHEITLMLQLLKRVETTLNKYLQDGSVEKYQRKQEEFIQKVKRQSVTHSTSA